MVPCVQVAEAGAGGVLVSGCSLVWGQRMSKHMLGTEQALHRPTTALKVDTWLVGWVGGWEASSALLGSNPVGTNRLLTQMANTSDSALP